MSKYFISSLLILLITFLTLKILDIFLIKYYGLGKPVLYEYSTITGYNIKPSQKLRRLGNEININELGMRSNFEWSNNKKKLKILFFGDSVTYGGSIISNKDLFSEIACEQLKFNDPKLDSICGNFGTNGYSIEQIVRKIKFKEINNEDILVITLIESNLERGFNSLASQPYWSKEIKGFYPAITESVFLILEKFKNSFKFSFVDKSTKNKKNVYQIYLLDEFKKIINSIDKKIFIVYSPTKNELKNTKNSLLKDYLEKNFGNFLDLSEPKYLLNTKMYYDDIHLNKLGHKHYGEIISKEILKSIKIN